MRSFRQRAMLSTAIVLVILCSACGGGNGNPQASESTQGFVPAPSPNTTATISATAATTATAEATPVPTPTPLGTPDVQASAQANGCSITPFASSGPPQVQSQFYPQWYGQGNLWFAPSSIYSGMFARTGQQQLMNLSVWFQGITPAVVLANEAPTITGHLQGDARTMLTTAPVSAQLAGPMVAQEPAHGVAITLPKPGCWQLTVTSGSQTLDVTLWAVPITQRPDVASLTALRTHMTPFSPPSTCHVTSWNGPADQGDPFSPKYWVSGQGMNVDSQLPVFFPTQSAYLEIYHAFPSQPSLTGQIAGNATAVVRSSWIQHATEFSPNGWRGEITFSNPGCWQLQVTDGSAIANFTVYVYPADCYHAITEPKPSSCKPPA